MNVRTLQSDGRYPSGIPENLLALVRKQADARDEAPILFVDSVTALAARDAVVKNEPMMTRYVYVSGPSIVVPSLLKVRIGTTIGDIIEECGGFSSAPSRIVVNGLISGTALYDLDTPITKTTKSLHIMDSDTCPDYEVHPCIHCGSCLRVCPVLIDPMKVVTAIRKERFSKNIRDSITSCQSCGCCAIVCPSRIPLHHIIREARIRMPKGGKE
jgi:electron transport complex protein RnfC